MLKKMATLAAALSLVGGSVAPAMASQPLSLANAPGIRAAAEMGASNALGGDDDQTMQIVALAGVGLLVLAFALLLDDDVDFTQPIAPQPHSP